MAGKITDEDPSARVFVRLYTKLLNDEAMVELSYGAVGVYVVALLLAKDVATDGVVSVRLLRRDAALRPDADRLPELVDELVDNGLAVRSGDGSAISIRNWTKYNKPAEEIVAERTARTEASLRANHQRWHVDGRKPKPECRMCRAEGLFGQVTPDRTPNRIHSDPPRNHTESQEREIEEEREIEKEQQPRTGSGPDGPPTPDSEAVVVEVADRLIELLGYVDQQARPDIRRYVAKILAKADAAPEDQRAQARRHAIDEMDDAAIRTMSKDAVADPVAYLASLLKHLAQPGTPIPGVATGTGANPAARARKPPETMSPERPPDSQEDLDAEFYGRVGYHPDPPDLRVVDGGAP